MSRLIDLPAEEPYPKAHIESVYDRYDSTAMDTAINLLCGRIDDVIAGRNGAFVSEENGAINIPTELDLIGEVVPDPEEEEEETSNMAVTTSEIIGGPANFPYTVDNLSYWVIHRKDGTMVKYFLDTVGKMFAPEVPARTTHTDIVSGPPKLLGPVGSSYIPVTTHTKGASGWCNHDPAKLPTFSRPKIDQLPSLDLFIADSFGIKKFADRFDFIIDAGDVFNLDRMQLFSGDAALCSALGKFEGGSHPRLLKINWDDRKAPDVEAAFWPALLAELHGVVGVNCQGGHGRSGTALVCMMMCMTDYDAYESIVHLRAIHCPRAIESKDQHTYIDYVAGFLGRTQNAAKAISIGNYRDAFLAVKSEFAKPYQARLEQK